MLDLLMAEYIQFVIILTKLKKVLSQELNSFCSKTTTVLCEWTVPETVDVSLLNFYCIINKYIVQKCMYTVFKCVYTVYTYSTGAYVD
jgi:hypothetical protein